MRLVDVAREPQSDIILWHLISERQGENPTNISFKMPTWEKHKKFVANPPYAHWCLINVEGKYIGYVSATKRNEIGIVLFKRHRGKGYGPKAVQLFMKTHAPLPAVASERRGRFIANINPSNENSIRMFEKLGFKRIQVTYES